MFFLMRHQITIELLNLIFVNNCEQIKTEINFIELELKTFETMIVGKCLQFILSRIIEIKRILVTLFSR